MRFWDSSAIVPLVLATNQTPSCHRVWRAEPRMMVWVLTPTEVLSALCRHRRQGDLDGDGFALAESRLEKLASRWNQVEALSPVKEAAARLLRVHPLRAADALQLGAALVAVDHRPKKQAFVSLDEDLLEAARREGFGAIEPK